MDTPEGNKILITITEIPSKSQVDILDKTAGGWRGTIDTEKLKGDINADRLISMIRKPKL